jgi:hypothetical protein
MATLGHDVWRSMRQKEIDLRLDILLGNGVNDKHVVRSDCLDTRIEALWSIK